MKKSFAIIALLALSTAAGATEVGVTASAGTTGASLHVTLPVMDSVNARLGVNGLKYNTDIDTDDANFDANLKLNTYDALLDWYPSATNFRLTAGLVYNKNRITVKAVPTAGTTYTFNDTAYDASQAGVVDGRMSFKKVAPYVGIGWGNALAKNSNWGFSTDVGVMYQGAPRTFLSNSGCSAGAIVCDQLAGDLAQESASLNDKVDKAKFYPVIRVGLSYKF